MMTAVITWKVMNMTREVSTGMVRMIEWLVEAVDGDIAARRGGQTVVSPALPEFFIPYENLTEATCLEWVMNALGTAGIEAIESNLQDQIQELISPKDAQGVPWAP